MRDTIERTANGAIVYDTTILNHTSDATFDPAQWLQATPVGGTLRAGGRGATMYVGDGTDEFVLRHFVRGGVPGRFVRDSYLWRGEGSTRSFAEWYLLARLRRRGLPVPVPAAARYQRYGPVYKADILTVRIPGIRSLADRITASQGSREFWRSVGGGLQQFHRHGVCHADLNAYNVQIGADDKLYLLDFDRGKLRDPGVWQQKNLARLHRSLRKIRSLDKRVNFSQAAWSELLEGYFSAARSE